MPDINDVLPSRICSECVGEEFLKSEITRKGSESICSACGKVAPTLAVGELADMVAGALERHFYLTESEPSDWDPAMVEMGLEDFEREGAPILDIISTVAKVEMSVAMPILAELQRRTPPRHDEGAFDNEAHYEMADPDDQLFYQRWMELEQIVKEESRFLSPRVEHILASVFEDLSRHRAVDGRTPLIEAGPGIGFHCFWRARQFQSDDKLRAALMNPVKDVGPPPHRLASAGRMNARGVSVFYGALDSETAVAEVRPPVACRVVVGRFELVRPIKLLDVEALRRPDLEGSVFDTAFVTRLKRAKFLERLSHRMSAPVMPDDEPFDYLATQLIADFLAASSDPALDGILFPSVQRKDAKNVVLFHKASRVEPIALPPGTEVSVETSTSTEDGLEEDYTVYERLPPAAGTVVPSDDADRREVTLRLDLGSLTVHAVTSVLYETTRFPVGRLRSPEKPRKY